MAITPQDIEQQAFSAAKQGYNTEEVDDFLELLAGEVDAMLNKIADLKTRLNNTEDQLAAAQAQLSEHRTETVVAPAAPEYGSGSFNIETVTLSQAMMSLRIGLKPADYDTRPLSPVPPVPRISPYNYETVYVNR